MRLFENVVNVYVDVDYHQRQISFYSNPVITLDWAAALFPPGADGNAFAINSSAIRKG
jgi:hypothetical protein